MTIVTDIRYFGGENIQIARRLSAMLENLIQTLPDSRAQLLRQELALIQVRRAVCRGAGGPRAGGGQRFPGRGRDT
jgi:hypothetical protein